MTTPRGLAEDVSKMLFSSLGSQLKDLLEKEISNNITACCVTKQTTQARAAEIQRMKQKPGQPFQSFLANIKSKAGSATCS